MNRISRWMGAQGAPVVVLALVIAGMAMATPVDKVLTTSVNPPGTGTVTGAGTYAHNTTVPVQASANPGYSFTGWTGDLTGTTNPDSVQMNQDRAVTANFAPLPPGSVTVTIAPPEVGGDAQWQLDGGALQNSGATLSNVSVGAHTVSFTDAAGWATPLPQAITVNTAANTAVTGTYYEYLGAECAAVGACNRNWETAGPEGWYIQTATSHDGVNALQSGAVGDGGYSVVHTTVTGPVDVTFWWKVATGLLEVVVNGTSTDDIAGDVDWTQRTLTLGAGVNEIAWVYVGAGAGYLDTFNVAETDLPTGSVEINGGAALAGSSSVTLALTWDDGDGSGVTRMRFSNNGSTWSAWENPAPTKAWTLAPGDGAKTVRAQFRDKAGNVSAVYSDTITVDTAPPTGTIVINNGDMATGSPTVGLTMTWDDGLGSGVTRMRFSNDGAVWSPWEPVLDSKLWTIGAVPGYYTVRVQFRDRAGNVSDRFSDYIRLVALP